MRESTCVNNPGLMEHVDAHVGSVDKA